jgi:hypothetical protein
MRSGFKAGNQAPKTLRSQNADQGTTISSSPISKKYATTRSRLSA